MSLDSIGKLEKIFLAEGEFPKDIRVFIPTSSQYIYVNNGHVQLRMSHFGLMSNLKSERGEVLDAFAKIEFVVVEMLRFIVVGLEPTDTILEVIKALSPKQRINVLSKLKYLDKDLATRLHNLVDIRNSLAHKFDTIEVIYKNMPLFRNDNFVTFQQELQQTWNDLILEYDRMLSGFDFTAMIKKIEDYKNTKV